MKLNARDIKRFLNSTELFGETELAALVREIKITHPLADTTLVSFTLNDQQMGILFDQLAETEQDVLNQVKAWGGQARILAPKTGQNQHFMLEGKVAYLITTKSTKQRLDRRLAGIYPGYSRSQLSALIKQGRVKIGAKVVQKANFLVGDDKITVDFPQKTKRQFEILWEDDDFIAIDKPSGVLSHSLNQIDDEWSVDDFARNYTKQSDRERVIAHRLDRDTSGVILAAKHPQALAYLKEQFAQRRVEKTYLALTSTTPHPESALIDLPLKRSAANPSKQEVSSNGRPAQTTYQVLRSTDKTCLIKLQPKTGRTHQLRVHLAYLKTAIIGDRLYGDKTAPRLMLHAYKIKFTKPNQQLVEIIATAPKEFNYNEN